MRKIRGLHAFSKRNPDLDLSNDDVLFDVVHHNLGMASKGLCKRLSRHVRPYAVSQSLKELNQYRDSAKLYDEVVRKPVNVEQIAPGIPLVKDAGKVLTIICPSCDTSLDVYRTSFFSTGKRCKCGVKLTKNGVEK